MIVEIRDGKTFEGSCLEIVEQMRHDGFNTCEEDSFLGYITFCCSNLRRHFGISLRPSGTTDAEVAESFVHALVAAGLATQVKEVLQ